ncbi:MAG: ABC transporter permease [Verrucomicrobia bacterium]|nr:MAG: ABC transporter permease [Verrucomicrobiota bacterium]
MNLRLPAWLRQGWRRLPWRGSTGRLLLLTLAVFAGMAALSPDRFLTRANLESMAFQFPELALLAFAILLTMLSAGIDLSVVATANLAGILAALVLTRWWPGLADGPAPFAVAAAGITALAAGGACGTVNGLLIARAGISPILATLGTLQLYTGLALVITRGHAVYGFPDALLFLGNGLWLGVPMPFWLFLGAAGLLAVLVNRTAFGVEARLLGTNPLAATFAALPVRGVLFRTYLASGLLGGLTGLLMIARTNSAKADYGSSYLLQAILIAVLGGVNPAGGFGTVLGVSLAVVALQALGSGFTLLGFSNFTREFVWGLFLLLIMVLNRLGRTNRQP